MMLAYSTYPATIPAAPGAQVQCQEARQAAMTEALEVQRSFQRRQEAVQEARAEALEVVQLRAKLERQEAGQPLQAVALEANRPAAHCSHSLRPDSG